MLELDGCYKNEVMSIEDGIPVFSLNDFYVKNYDRISDDHLKHFETTGQNPFMDEDYWQEIEMSTVKIIEKYVIGDNKKILDVGVGMGRLLSNFPDLKRYGLDISRGYLRHAKKCGIEVCMSRIEDMPYKDGYFDLVVTTDVLEHVLDLNLAFQKILDVTKESGVIVVRVPYKEDLSGYLQPDYPYDLVHLRNFDENSLKIFFEKIFNIQVLEYSVAGYKGQRVKPNAVFRHFPTVSQFLMKILRNNHVKIYEYMCSKFYLPTVINMVVRKSTMDHSRSH